MSKVITFSRFFPSSHPKAGQPTYFVEKFLKGRPNTAKNIIQNELWQPEKSLIDQLPLALDIWAELKPKYHTIRSGNRWKEGEYFSPRVWGDDVNPKSLKKGAYHSKQITLAPDTLITKVYDFEIKQSYMLLPGDYPSDIIINHRFYNTGDPFMKTLAQNDGLSLAELLNWFKYPKPFQGQIICWGDVEY
jgi:hypothetical protein